MIVSKDFFLSNHVVDISQSLLGKYVFTKSHGVITGGMIIETEAYAGPEDRAAHSYNNRRTPRNEIMFQEGGVCYVYVCYGIHFLLNFVCGGKGIPHGVLIRGLLPTMGLEEINKRMGFSTSDKKQASGIEKPIFGPGSVAKALGIDQSFYGEPLNGKKIWVEDHKVIVTQEEILIGPRVGIDYAGEDRLLPWRFRVKKYLKKTEKNKAIRPDSKQKLRMCFK